MRIITTRVGRARDKESEVLTQGRSGAEPTALALPRQL
jgi:hypothetical protein